MSGYQLMHSVHCNGIIPVYKYKSADTGITIIIAEVDGPVIRASFCLATEAFDDDGLPHALEHMVFLGSNKYPCKGVLDLLNNRCLTADANASTHTDHTRYNVTTIGAAGFLTLLPIYAEHILNPTLTDAAFQTEVHHVDGEGKDAGVVYCEMEERENNAGYMVAREMRRALYPGDCGYKYIAGGSLENLRDNVTIERIRQYHEEYYCPENLAIVITGTVDHKDIFDALQPLEDQIIAKGPSFPFDRPWHNPIPPLLEDVEREIIFPAHDEEYGLICFGWRGPSSINQLYELTACSLLLKYLTDNYLSPIHMGFIDMKDPWARIVATSITESASSIMHLTFGCVKPLKIPFMKHRLIKLFRGIVRSNFISMKKMRNLITREMHDLVGCLENMPHDVLADMLVSDALYGNSRQSLNHRLNQNKDFEKLLNEPVWFWLNLLRDWFIEAPVVTIAGIPSMQKLKKIAEIERDRVTEQIEVLGRDELARSNRELQEALMVDEETPELPEILDDEPIIDLDQIPFHQIRSYMSDGTDQHPRFDISQLPLFTYLDDVNTNFIYMLVVMDTALIDVDARLYLPLLFEAMLESAVVKNRIFLSYPKVVAGLDDDTVAASTDIGLFSTTRFSCGSYSHHAKLMLQVEIPKYAEGVQWVHDLLFNTHFTVGRVKDTALRMMREVAQYKNDGPTITESLMNGLLYDRDCNHYSTSLLRQNKFLMEIMARLNTEEGRFDVLRELNAVRSSLLEPTNMALYMATNVDKLVDTVGDVYGPWNTFEGFDDYEKDKIHVTPEWAMMKPPEDITIQGCVVGVNRIDSMYFSQCTSSISDYNHPDLAALLVCLQYFTQVEGPMWKQIRESGLAEDYGMYVQPHEGLLYLRFHGAPDIAQAYGETKAIIERHVIGDQWNFELFISAKSSLAFEVIDEEKSVGGAILESLHSLFKNVYHGFNRHLLKRAFRVKLSEMKRVAKRYLKGLFDPHQCFTTVVCHPQKAAKVARDLKPFNHELRVFKTLDKSYLNEW